MQQQHIGNCAEPVSSNQGNGISFVSRSNVPSTQFGVRQSPNGGGYNQRGLYFGPSATMMRLSPSAIGMNLYNAQPPPPSPQQFNGLPPYPYANGIYGGNMVPYGQAFPQGPAANVFGNPQMAPLPGYQPHIPFGQSSSFALADKPSMYNRMSQNKPSDELGQAKKTSQ